MVGTPLNYTGLNCTGFFTGFSFRDVIRFYAKCWLFQKRVHRPSVHPHKRLSGSTLLARALKIWRESIGSYLLYHTLRKISVGLHLLPTYLSLICSKRYRYQTGNQIYCCHYPFHSPPHTFVACVNVQRCRCLAIYHHLGQRQLIVIAVLSSPP